MQVEIHGHCEPRFAEVESVFCRRFEKRQEVGASVCVYHDGRPVVDLFGGVADADTGRIWQRHTLAVLASTSKALAATAALLLVERGQLDLDAPVADYWPEFAAQGKQRVLVRWLLAHRAGLAALDRPPITMEEKRAFRPVVEAIAAQRPFWEPGAAHGYHAVTFGFAVSELIRRITGLTVGQFFDKEIARPLQLDLYIGLPPDQLGRVAEMVSPSTAESIRSLANCSFFSMYKALADKSSLAHRATFGAVQARFEDKEAWHQYDIEDASAAALGNAAGLARMFAALIGKVDGIQLLRPDLMEQARHAEASGLDRVLCLRADWGLGYMLPGGPMWPDFGARAFGHGGASGSLAFADPENRIAFGYVPNKWGALGGGLLRPQLRYASLVDAVYRVLRRKSI